MVKVERLDKGIHSLVKVICKDYNGNNIFFAEYLVTIQKLGDPENDTVQAILDDIEANKGNVRINEILMYTEDDFGERHPFFEMDDCEAILF